MWAYLITVSDKALWKYGLQGFVKNQQNPKDANSEAEKIESISEADIESELRPQYLLRGGVDFSFWNFEVSLKTISTPVCQNQAISIKGGVRFSFWTPRTWILFQLYSVYVYIYMYMYIYPVRSGSCPIVYVLIVLDLS